MSMFDRDWGNAHPEFYELVDMASGVELGEAFKAAFQYMEDGTIADLSPLAGELFGYFKKDIDEEVLELAEADRKPWMQSIIEANSHRMRNEDDDI